MERSVTGSGRRSARASDSARRNHRDRATGLGGHPAQEFASVTSRCRGQKMQKRWPRTPIHIGFDRSQASGRWLTPKERPLYDASCWVHLRLPGHSRLVTDLEVLGRRSNSPIVHRFPDPTPTECGSLWVGSIKFRHTTEQEIGLRDVIDAHHCLATQHLDESVVTHSCCNRIIPFGAAASGKPFSNAKRELVLQLRRTKFDRFIDRRRDCPLEVRRRPPEHARRTHVSLRNVLRITHISTLLPGRRNDVQALERV